MKASKCCFTTDKTEEDKNRYVEGRKKEERAGREGERKTEREDREEAIE